MKNLNFNNELVFKASRSSGKGGQHVNKVSSRIELLFDLSGSSVLNRDEKRLVRKRLKNKISKEGILRIVCQTHRSQLKNKKLATQRFETLIGKALETKKTRIPTKPTKGMIAHRLKKKQVQSEKKARRKKVNYSKIVDLSLWNSDH